MKFHVGDVLSITTGVLLAPTKMKAVYKILNHMSGRSLLTHELPDEAERMKFKIWELYPTLRNVVVERVTEKNYKNVIKRLAKDYGKEFEIPGFKEK